MNSFKRKLGLLENLFHEIHNLGGMIDVNVARIEGEISVSILQEALNSVQKRHPMLQVQICELSDGAYFKSEGMQKIPLKVIDRKDENHWLKIAEEELHLKFSYNNNYPLCRLTLLSSSLNTKINEIIFTFHHSITDGLSCINFLDELLSDYQKITDGKIISNASDLSLPLPLENLLDRSSIADDEVKKIQENSAENQSFPLLIIEKEAVPEQRRTRLLNRILERDGLLSLKNRCKKEQTTIHGALCASMLFVLANLALEDTPLTLSCGSSINLRKACEPELASNIMGCFVSIIEALHSLEKNTIFWDLARDCKSKIQHSINIGRPIAGIFSDRLSSVNRESLIYVSNERMGRTNTVSISNRGKFELSDRYGNLKLKEIYFATGQHWIGPCFWLGALTFHEKLFCSFVHVEPLLSNKQAELLADSFIATIKKACVLESLQLTSLNKDLITDRQES